VVRHRAFCRGKDRSGSILPKTRVDENPYRGSRFAECHACACELPYARRAADYRRDAVTPEWPLRRLRMPLRWDENCEARISEQRPSRLVWTASTNGLPWPDTGHRGRQYRRAWNVGRGEAAGGARIRPIPTCCGLDVQHLSRFFELLERSSYMFTYLSAPRDSLTGISSVLQGICVADGRAGFRTTSMHSATD
jgi:hypothetical protein